MTANTLRNDEAAHAPADEPYRAVAGHLPDAVVLFDLDLRIRLTTGSTTQALANVEQHANARRLRTARGAGTRIEARVAVQPSP